jgi:hypothetical protein
LSISPERRRRRRPDQRSRIKMLQNGKGQKALDTAAWVERNLKLIARWNAKYAMPGLTSKIVQWYNNGRYNRRGVDD